MNSNSAASRQDLERRVRARLDSLTKPPGSLGRLESIAVRFALIRGEEMPSPARKGMYVFCGDHGIADSAVSAYPPEVTNAMLRNFSAGGAAINVLCRSLGISPEFIDVGVRGPSSPRIRSFRIAEGTRNFIHEPAMTREQAGQAVGIGRTMAQEAAMSYDLVGLGEMGIGNTSSASAILSLYSGRPACETAGAGSGLSPEGISRKAELIQKALNLHRADPSDPMGVIAAVGGFEIAALAGFMVEASLRKLPYVLDGFIVCAAALLARALQPDVLENAFFSHVSREQGHTLMVKTLGGSPYFNLDMRLGEGTGAALMMGLIDSAVRLYREMSTFAEAGI